MALPEIRVKVSADTAQAKSGLKSVEASIDSVNAKQRAATASGKAFAGSMKASASQTANLGAQLNDIGVILAAGQSPLQLAVQQGSQINQVFAQMGGGKQALRGLAAGFASMVNPMSLATIGVIAGGAALVQWAASAFGASEEAEKLAEKLEEVRGRQEALNEEIRGFQLGASAEELTLLDAIAAKRQEITELQSKITPQTRIQIAAETEVLGELLAQLDRQRQLEAQKARLLSSTRELADQERLVGQQTEYTGQKLAENERIAGLLRDGISATVIEAMQLAGIDMASPISTAAAEAARLASNLGIALDAAMRIANWSATQDMTDEDAAMAVPFDNRRATATGRAAGMQYNFAQGRGGGGRRGGGGGGSAIANQMAARLETLVQSLKTEREVLEEWRTEGIALLASANEAELEALGGHNEARLRLEQEYQERLSKIKEDGAMMGLKTTLKAGQDIANAIGTSNDRALKIAQSFGAAISLINAYQAASETLKDPTLPWFARIGAAASVLAAGIGFVNSIKSVSSGGDTAGAGAGVAANSTSAPTPRRLAEYNITGTQVSNLGSLVDDINEAVSQGYQIQLNYTG